MSEAFRARLAAASHDEREFQSQHHYTLEEFGLSKEWIPGGTWPITRPLFAGPLTSESPEGHMDQAEQDQE